ncbi:uncharacterized protein LOC114516947 [Dendronephthya gigantea]|uniref:uncharacterized protein LOC114516947 n=1 Tax=Dendronephthya gigantea TaxID=151771 RepID=UPI001069BDFD|nr:uncharacterized protein LOC114516947 [Dendronephthya gigantea]
MKVVKLFLEEITKELLYNIVHANDKFITFSNLNNEFKRKTGYEPAAFFGYSIEEDSYLLDFINGIPGLRLVQSMIMPDDSDEEDTRCVYRIFNSTHVDESGVNKTSVAEYRERLLLKCCEIMQEDFADLGNCKDTNGNTPLHLLAALPGICYGVDTLAKYLLDAGVDPLVENNNGQTFLHIIFGSFKAKIDHFGAVCFTNERLAATKWYIEDRKSFTDLVSEELSRAQVTSLVKAQDKGGNTLLHEWAISSTVQHEYIHERRICTKLLELGANLRVQSCTGEVPLHYAYNPSVFKIFVLKGAVCRARNDRDETPILFLLKKSVELAFSGTPVFAEIMEQGFIELTSNIRSVGKATKLLENLIRILAENTEARKVVFIPDVEGNVAIDIVLTAIRIGSYDLKEIGPNLAELRSSLLELLSELLCDADTSDITRRNMKGQSFLHVLLDMGDEHGHEIIRGAYILRSIDILLAHGADVNAVDSEGRTPLDVANEHLGSGPVFYQKCAQLLIDNGAVAKHDLEGGNHSQDQTVQKISAVGIQNLARKLRSCPKRYRKYAESLVDSSSDLTAVEKYRYFSQDSIGSGAFSAIFVAIKDENVDNVSGTIDCRAYALKRIDKAKVNAFDIKREITALLAISGKCENIIKYYEFVEDNFFQYICLDLMDGDLHEFVANDEVNSILGKDPAMPINITKEIINGLTYLHGQKFIHRDLKPGNILYTTDPALHFKIADFGLMKNLSSLSTMITPTRGSGVAMAPGTRCWMAPELVSMKSKEHTQNSDIFSLGLVLHYLLTMGKHAFTTEIEEPAHVIERKIAEMQINLDKALHPEAASFLLVLLTKDPTKRPPASFLGQHPFLWSASKKIEFLKAVGDQPEAISPFDRKHLNSPLEKYLQMTHTGREIRIVSWDQFIERMFIEMMNAWKAKKYRTDKVIDLIRFIRNSYAHKQERSLRFQQDLNKDIFLRQFPFLVLDVFGVVQQLEFDARRSNILLALSL